MEGGSLWEPNGWPFSPGLIGVLPPPPALRPLIQNSSETAEGQDAVTRLPSLPHLEGRASLSVAETLNYRAFLCCS